MRAEVANLEMAKAWDGDDGAHWAEHQPRCTRLRRHEQLRNRSRRPSATSGPRQEHPPSLENSPSGRGGLVRRSRAFVCVLALSAATAVVPGGRALAVPAVFKVGVGVRDITPNPVVAPPDGNVYLGGFGLGLSDNRMSTGVAMPITARAMAISNGTDTVVFGINETQGMFASYGDGPWGLDDMRRQISADTGVPMGHIVLGTNHSHRGPDTTGVWGGLPPTYLTYIRDQMVAAADEAVATMTDATIRSGFADDPSTWGGDLWPGVPDQDVKDTVIRSLQARRTSDGSAIATFVEVPYHSTVYGSATTIHPDYEGVLERSLEAAYGGTAIVWEGDIGRQYAGNRDTLNERLLNDVAAGLATGWDLTDSTIAGGVRRFVEPVTNPLYIYFLTAAKTVSLVTCTASDVPGVNALCTPVDRTRTPPYGAAVAAGTYATTFRVGDLFFAGGPGEVYPNVQRDLVAKVGARNHFFLGLAQDQIGYLISPAEAWPGIVATQTGSDNWIFNASPTVGDHLECTQLAGAQSLGFAVAAIPDRCGVLTATDPLYPQD